MHRIIKNIFIVVLSVGLLSAFSVLAVLWAFSNNLPDYKFLKNYKPSVSSKVYSGDGELVNDFSSEKRIFVPYKSIPEKVINAFLSAEDKNFYSHPGVDAKGVLRAIINNISNVVASRRLEGASTITQQVAKNFLLTNEVSLNRKIKEAILAFRIERALSKERILELYLNQIYLGEGTYGVASASLEYFDKSISELNYEEAALLAALPKAPSRYNPYKNIELAKFRRDLVINNLFENNYISKQNQKELLSKKIILKKRKKIFTEDTSYYVEDIRKDVVEKLGFDKVYKQGLNISTPINISLQKIATDSLRQGLIEYDKRKGWRGPLSNVIDPYCDCSLSPNRLRLGPLIIIILLLIKFLYIMKKIKKIKIKLNGKFSTINENLSLLIFLKELKIPLKKVAIELNQEIIDKNNLKTIKLKNNDKIEIVHFIGGG